MTRRRSQSSGGGRGKVYVLGSHPLHGFSMSRYTNLLAEGWRRAGKEVVVLRPTSVFSRKIAWAPARKFIVYVENLVLFGLRLAFLRAGDSPVHIADHSDAVWLSGLWRPRLSIVTCHDLIALRAARGELREHRTRVTGRIYQRLVKAGLSRASLLASVSNATDADVQRLIPGVRRAVILNPLAPTMDPLTAPVIEVDHPNPYLIVVSTVGWRKRRDHALRVWARLARASDGPLDLILVGPMLTPQEEDIRASVGAGELHLRQGASDEELSGLYARALAVVQVSRYEGFGWPVVEGNVHGTPAVCSEIAVLREIGPSNVFISDELDQVDWASMKGVLSSPSLSSAVKQDAARYRMPQFTRRLLDALSRVEGGVR